MPQTLSPLTEVAQQLRAARRILAFCHVDPDGDAIGSLLGLGWLLRELEGERTVVLACQDAPPANLRFLPGADAIVADPAPTPWDLIVALDASDPKRLGELFARVRKATPRSPLLVIDHHITNLLFGDMNYVNPIAAATAQILTELATVLPAPIRPEAATCLLAGLVTDTLGFRTTNTTADALAAGIRLIEAGGDLADLAQRTLNDRPVAILRLWGMALAKMRLENHVISVAVSRAMRAAAGIPDDDTGELVSQLITANEARIAVVFNEVAKREVKVSLRARRPYNVAQVALMLGGGGHPQAAGCLIQGTLAEAQARLLPLLAAAAGQGDDK